MIRRLALGVLSLTVIIGTGLLLADHLAPPASGVPSQALVPQTAQTPIDR